MPLVAMALVVMLGLTAFSVDLGYDQYQQRNQQNATDSAAIAATAALADGTASSTAAGKAAAATNGYTDGTNGVTVSITPNYSDSYTGSSSAAKVKIVKNNYPKFFGNVFGSGNVTITTTAVARMVAGGNYCLYQLNPAGSPNLAHMNWNGPNCGIIMNGTGNFQGSNVDASVIGYSGSAPGENAANFTNATPAPSLPATDPCPQIPGCNYLTNNPPSTSSCDPNDYKGYNGTLTPGCYSGTNFKGSNITFTSGVYVFTSSGLNFNGANLNGTATLYFPSTTCANFNGANNQLSAPASGPTAGVLIYQESGNSGCTPNFNGSNSTTPALVYFASYSVNYNGSNGGDTMLVCSDVNFNGSNESFPAPAGNNGLVEQPVLAE